MTAQNKILFRPQVFHALTLIENGDLDPATTDRRNGAGEIGMVRCCPVTSLRTASTGW